MDLCKTAPSVDHIKLFTNGLLPESLLAYLIDYEGPALSIILNIHHPSEYPSGQWDKLKKVMMGLGDKITLGYNIYQTGNDFGFLLELFRQYKVSHHVRLGLTQPILGVNNIHLPLESLPDVAQEIVAAAHLFTREGLFFSFDCGFPFCMFSLDQHQELLSCAIKFRSSCNPVVDIGPDLSVWRCFPLSSIYNRRLQEFETRMDIEYYYSELFRSYRQFGIYPRCTECDYKIQGLCSGGCLSRVLREFQGSVVEEALVQQLAPGSP
jgi:radical SAM protein with 4Fe4S-binding SPASM domain